MGFDEYIIYELWNVKYWGWKCVQRLMSFGRCTQTSLPSHCSQLITQKSVASASSVCQWKFFTKPYFCLNPVGKSKVPSWKIFISLLENYFFSVGKSNFRSRAILDDFFGSLLNYFKRFLFILKPCTIRQLKVKMFDSARWAMSDESWVMSFFDKRTEEYKFIWGT